jgi:predicted RNA-binding Zn ribbon-like protein
VLARRNGLQDDERAGRLRGLAARKREASDRVVSRPAACAAPCTMSWSAPPHRQPVAGWRFPGSPQLTKPLDAFLVSAGDLLVERPRIGVCPGHGSGWLFLDRTGLRRWCQMAVCGNRAKQAAHVARARSWAEQPMAGCDIHGWGESSRASGGAAGDYSTFGFLR